MPDMTAWRRNIEDRLAAIEARFQQLGPAAALSSKSEPADPGGPAPGEGAAPNIPPSLRSAAARLQLAEAMTRLADKMAREQRSSATPVPRDPKPTAARPVLLILVATGMLALLAVQRTIGPGASPDAVTSDAVEAPAKRSGATVALPAAVALPSDAPEAPDRAPAAQAPEGPAADLAPTSALSPAATATNPTSFDCDRATAPDERLICRTPRLAAADLSGSGATPARTRP